MAVRNVACRSSILGAVNYKHFGRIPMKRTIPWLAVIILCLVGSASALYEVTDRGEWPKSWPEELEPLRKQAMTFEGPLAPGRYYAIRFTKPEEFESAWPHILKVKKKGAPLRLVRAPNFFLGENRKAGVVIHSPAGAQAEETAALELVVDGEIVDLNHIPLPADTRIIDERFKDREKKSPERSGN